MDVVAVSASPEQSRLFRVRKTLTKMLTKRDYLVPDEFSEETLEQFCEKWSKGTNRDTLELLVRRNDNDDDKVIVFFPDDKVSVKHIKSFREKMKELAVQRCIIVISESMTTVAKKSCLETDVVMECFREEELLVDITEHVLVPEHTVLKDVEKSSLLKRYKLVEYQLPRIMQSDPIARYYGLQKGQVIKITRPSETAGRYVTYRLVI